MASETAALYRPVGKNELALIQKGGKMHEEYWIPAEDLEKFNRNIVGKIELIAEFRG